MTANRTNHSVDTVWVSLEVRRQTDFLEVGLEARLVSQGLELLLEPRDVRHAGGFLHQALIQEVYCARFVAELRPADGDELRHHVVGRAANQALLELEHMSARFVAPAESDERFDQAERGLAQRVGRGLL